MCVFISFPKIVVFQKHVFVIEFLRVHACIVFLLHADTKAEMPPVSVTEHSDMQMSKCNRHSLFVLFLLLCVCMCTTYMQCINFNGDLHFFSKQLISQALTRT